MNNTLITISTFKKNQGATELIESLLNHNYTARIVLTDDSDNFNAVEVYNKFRKDIPITYIGGSINLGVAHNKNRGIKYFLEHPKYENILMLDDDCLFHKPGLLEHLDMICREDDTPLTSGLWTDKMGNTDDAIKQLYGEGGWTDQFPIKGGTKYQTYHSGCHGFMMYLRRELVSKVGYMSAGPLRYGFEHSLYFSRCLMYLGLAPELFPIMRYTPLWLRGNNIPNDYTVNQEEVFRVQGDWHRKSLQRVYQGLDLVLLDHGCKKKWKGDRILES